MPRPKKDLSTTDPKANTLFGHPPKRKKMCLGCAGHAELFDGRYCWLCCHNGTREAAKKLAREMALAAAKNRRRYHVAKSATPQYQPKVYKVHVLHSK